MRTIFTLAGILGLALLTGQDVDISILTPRNIGPANQGGRIVDIDAHANDFTKVYAATASGGVWKSENAGTTWTSIFDHYETASIGDIQIDPNDPNILWVGTGEANNRNSVSWGNGIYKSTDGGAHFENMGLESTHQIARVSVHPDDSNDVCVCALGHLWGYSGERGLFQTKNGGRTWEKQSNGLPNDGKTGCIDLVRDSKDPNTIYTAFYHRLRQPWHFHSGGGEGGIYKSTDNGKSWTKLANGLPQGPTGRIGLAIYEKNPKILMAIVEAEKTDDLEKPGSGIYRSEDGGASWKYVNTYNNRPFYYSQIRINPHDDQRVYVLTTRFMVSSDGGNNFANGSVDQEVHGDFHAMWLDPLEKDRYYLGADKGFSLTHDHGQHFQLMDNMPIGQFYRINYDMQVPYYVYGGFQDNGSYATASFARDARGILNDHNWKMHWGDGQDVVINPNDRREAYSSMENGSYFSYNPMTHDLKRISPEIKTITNFSDYYPNGLNDPNTDIRFNWSAPMVMSQNDPAVLYIAGNHIYKSKDKGVTWEFISPDLSTNDAVKRVEGNSGGVTPDNTGAETHCSVHSISISPIDERVIWAGTDDGNVQCTMDGGATWKNMRTQIPGVPAGLWVSRVEASHFDVNRVYVTFDGHRSDNFDTWIFKSDDNGKSWQKITTGIQNGETIRVIREDHKNPDLLFAGSETGVWYSINRGVSWVRLPGLPTVSIYDLKIHPRDNDLIIGTHGRSVWIVDDISPLQELGDISSNSTLHVFHQRPTIDWKNVSRGGQRGHFLFEGDNPSNIANISTKPRAYFETHVPITFYIKDLSIDSAQLEISNLYGTQKVSLTIPIQQGINRYHWDRTFESIPFTEVEKRTIEASLKEIQASNNASSIRRIINRYNDADTPEAQRRALSSLTRGYLSYDYMKQYAIPKAGLGTYNFTISTSDVTQKGTFSIIEDPLVEQKD